MEADRPAPNADALLAQLSWLRLLARELVGEQLADDLSQEVQIRALARPLRETASLRPWLARVTRNLAASWHRSRTRRPPLRDPRPAAPSADALAAEVELQRIAVGELLALPEIYRNVLLQRFYSDLQPGEIAQRQQIPVETVRTRIKRGLALLRERLDQRAGGRHAWLPMFATALTQSIPGGIMIGAKTASVAAAASLAFLIWLAWPEAQRGDPEAELASPEAPMRSGIESPVATTPQTSGRMPAGTVPSQAAPVERVGLRGRLVDAETLAPVAGAQIRLAPASNLVHPSEPVVSDARGGFELSFEYRPPARVRLAIRSPQHAPAAKVLDAPDGTRTLDCGEIRLAAGTQYSGILFDAAGLPAADTQLFVGRHGSYRLQLKELEPIGTTMADGRFALEERLIPHPEPHLLVAIGRSGAGWLPIRPLLRRSEQRLELRLLAGASLDVTVVDETGTPLEQAYVVAEPTFAPFGAYEPNGIGTARGATDLFSRRTAVDGHARFDRLPVAEPRLGELADSSNVLLGGHRYAIEAQARGFEPAHATTKLDPLRPATVVLRMQRSRERILTGTVRSTGGRPLAAATVHRAGGRVTTDSDGSFELRLGSRSGKFLVYVEAEGHVLHRETLTVGAESRIERRFVLRPGFPLHGRVVDRQGRPEPGVSISITEGDLNLVPLGLKTGDDGTFRLDAAPPTAVLLRIDRLAQEVRAADSPITIVLPDAPGPVRITAAVVDKANGRPLDPSSFWVLRVGAASSQELLDVERSVGRIAARGLDTGSWRLRVDTADGRRADVAFEVQPGQQLVDLRVEIGAPGSIVARFDWQDVPPSMRPARASLWTVPQEGRWVQPEGRRLVPVSRGFAVPETRDPTVQFADVTPGVPIQVRMRADFVLGEANVTVPDGGTAEITIRPRIAAKLTVRTRQPMPVADLWFATKAESEAWNEMHYAQLPNRRFELDSTLPAGVIAWRLSFRSPRTEDGNHMLRIEGSVKLEPGAGTEVVVDLDQAR